MLTLHDRDEVECRGKSMARGTARLLAANSILGCSHRGRASDTATKSMVEGEINSAQVVA